MESTGRVRTLGDRWERHCGRKLQHLTRRSAEQEAVRLTSKERAIFNVYHCECCGAWHVGHSNVQVVDRGRS